MVYLGLLELLVLCVGVFPQTGVTEECNVTFRSKLKSRTECFTTYGDCGFNKLQERFPSLYNKSEWRRDPPSNIKPSSFCEPDTSGVNQSGINIQWNLPNSKSAEDIAGYELRVEGDPLNFRCLIVILEEKPTKENIYNVLNSTMFPVRRHHNYMIVLLTLPRANDSGTGFKEIMSMNCKRGSSSGDWTPAGHNYSYDWPEKRLIVWFEPPPPKYNLTKFQIYLIRGMKFLSKSIINTTEVIFRDKEPGIYRVFMEPYNENPFDKDLCVCRDDEGTCKGCKSSEWEIAAEIPKKSAAAASKGHLREIIAGVCVFVIIAIIVLVLYKILAKRCGIECVLGQNKMKTTDILHVLCIDIDCPREHSSKLRFLLQNNFNTKIKFIRIAALSDTMVASKMSAQWNKWNISTIETPIQRSSNDTTVCESEQKTGDISNILICLMVSCLSDEKLSEYMATLRANLPSTGQLKVQICAVTYADKSVFVQSKTAFKCYFLNHDKQDFVTAVKRAFSGHTMDKNVPVVYTCGKPHSDIGIQNGVKVDTKSRRYVALPKSQTCISRNVGDFSKTERESKPTNSCVPEVMYLGDMEPRRERYVSNDSGRGASEFSYKPGYSPEDRNGFWEETTTLPSALLSHQFHSTNQNGFMDKYRQKGAGCPSCDISFFPPDPSVISENDFDSNTLDLNAADDSVNYVTQFQKNKYFNCQNGGTRLNANSMDSLMDKMAEINERSAISMLENSSPGEVHSVWEGHV